MLSNERKWDDNPFTGSRNPVIAWRIHSHHHTNKVVVRAWLTISNGIHWAYTIVNFYSFYLFIVIHNIVFISYLYIVDSGFHHRDVWSREYGSSKYYYDINRNTTLCRLHCNLLVGASIIVAWDDNRITGSPNPVMKGNILEIVQVKCRCKS